VVLIPIAESAEPELAMNREAIDVAVIAFDKNDSRKRESSIQLNL